LPGRFETDTARSLRAGLSHTLTKEPPAGEGAGSILRAVDRICPFLALSVDHRTAVDGFDPDHVCHALDPAEPIERQRQAAQCLVEAHRQCDRYAAFLSARAATVSFPAPAPDAQLARTRLVVEPDARRSAAGALAPLGMSPSRWAIAGGVAVVGVAAAATAMAGGFGAPGQRATGAAVTPPPDSASPTPLATPEPTLRPTALPTPEQTEEPSQRPRPSATVRPQQQTYVVQAGDTLSLIASQFGTSVSSIQQANGLNSDVINVGQVLVIP
jgi:LysM repeat protein